jgi:superfamily II DNA helicase RecQ
MCVVRDSTVRGNIAYSVVGYTKENEDKEVRRLVDEKLAQYPAPGQVIVYCRFVEQARRLAKTLNCSVYHRSVGNKTAKEGILRRLTGQSERVFTATNALGIGIDAPSIRTVIHVGISSQMKQYS